MDPRWLEDRREGREQDAEAIQGFVRGVLDGTVTRAQAAAWLSFVVCRGMSRRETVDLTRAMADSGRRLSWEGIEGPFVDKHSTGGVGDKTSLILAPLWATMGSRVPMISGRGLGITGGTLDKLEAIPGFRTDLDPSELRETLKAVGCFISGATADIAPADRMLYALRDETATVPSVPLITASILSKKLCEGIERLVLDVKWGTGAFMRRREEAEILGSSLRAVGEACGLRVEIHFSDMNQPLGRTVGNALEVEEAVGCLRGEGPQDLVDLVATLSGEPDRARALLAAGEAVPAWRAMVRAQGGDPDAPLKGADCQRSSVPAPCAGRVTGCDAGEIGRAAFALGAGRRREGEAVHPGVGVVLGVRAGDSVARGEPLADLHHDAGRGLEEARARVLRAMPLT